ncbi:efflux transporter outer membrane subunit [Sphingopyxis indica]|uniref:Outer membrane protein, multidrug efflux system n=1 Tax=Sphingopyxis indica TaxID=436663 RepID=A0A239JXW0_9SPHN|nr:efflux transporter outer membrane subunit [Sphingopyxis indica]SNT10826.1 outer membrane protein, multidrug efflux system [Sphingopyxis indica]
MKKSHVFLAAIASVGLTGCMAPKYVPSAMPVPDELAVEGTVSETAAYPPDVAWEEFFTDQRLRNVVRIALDNNRDLRVALATMEQARALYRVQRADLLPTIGIDGSATYQDYPGGVSGAGGSGGGTALGGRNDIYTASVGISSWEIDLFGRTRNLSKAALEQYFASVENRNAAQTALIAEVATAWLTLAADQERLRIARETEQAFADTLALTRARFAKGIASELEVRQAQTSHDQARSDIAEGTTRVDQARNALNLLAGTTVRSELLPEQLPETGATFAQLPAELPSEVLLRRPDIAAAEHQLRAANANIGAARAAFFPRISLTAALGTISLGLSNLFGNGSDYWSVAPAASVPIFDFGRNQGNLRYAEATRDAMVARYEQSIQTGFREVADALARRGTIASQLEAQTSLQGAAASAYRLSEARFRSGIDSFLTTLDAQRTYYAAQQSLLATRYVREANAVELYRALGGGLK